MTLCKKHRKKVKDILTQLATCLPSRVQPSLPKLSPMANGDSKSKPINEETRRITKYRECWRNHAILIGGYVVDGCGEFTPEGVPGTKEAFICEACGCHRNFHRKQLIKNGIILLDTHHSPPPYRLHGASMWVEKTALGFHPLSSVSLTAPPPPPHPCHLHTSVSDQESLVCSGSKSEKKMKARKRPKRSTLMHNKKGGEAIFSHPPQ